MISSLKAVTDAAAGTTALVGDAVRRSAGLSVEGLLERLFARVFSGLVYPVIWEDAAVDLEAMEINSSSRIVTIASGGCNVLNYLALGPECIHAVDLNAAHIALNRLKLEALRRLDDHASLFALLGAGDRPGNVALYRSHIRPHLDAQSRAYWDGRDLVGRVRIGCFERGFHRYGLLGRCIGAAHSVARLHGHDPRRMMTARTRLEQQEIFDHELRPLFERRLVRWMLGHRTALYGLGIPPAQYAALLGDAPHMADVVCERLRRLACDFDLRTSHFAWQAFHRGYAGIDHPSLPPYLEAANFDRLKQRVNRVTVELRSFTDFLSTQPACSLDRFVLLDAQDWMDDQALTRLWTEITRTARPGARVIFRTAGAGSILPGRVPAALLDHWHYAEHHSRRLWEKDRSAIYGGFHLYVLIEAS